MQFKKEVKEIMYKYEVDMTDEEFLMLRNYADDNIGGTEHDSLLINWAVVDILTKQLEKAKKGSTCLKKKKSKKKE